MMFSWIYLLYLGLWVKGGIADDQRLLIRVTTEGHAPVGHRTADHFQPSLIESILAFRAMNELEFDINTTLVYSVAMNADMFMTEVREHYRGVMLSFQVVHEHPTRMEIPQGTLGDVIISTEHIIKSRGSGSGNLTTILVQPEVNVTVGYADTEYSVQSLDVYVLRMESRNMFTRFRSRRGM